MEAGEAEPIAIILAILDLVHFPVLARDHILVLVLVPAHHRRIRLEKIGTKEKAICLRIIWRGMMAQRRKKKMTLQKDKKKMLRKKTKTDLLLPKVLHYLRKIANGQKSEVVVEVRVLIVMNDRVEEKETENGDLIGIIIDHPIPVLLDLCLDHDLRRRRSLGHIHLCHYHVRLLPPVILEIDGVTVDRNVAAESSIVGPHHGEESTPKMDLRRINGQFSFLSW